MSEHTPREGEEELDPAAQAEAQGQPDPNAAPGDENKPTQAGQVEIVAGSPEHQALLAANPNATSYGPNVNIVQPPVPEEPAAEEVAEGEEEPMRRDDESEEDFEQRFRYWQAQQQQRGR